MTIDDMVEYLNKLSIDGHGKNELMILDGFNGGGLPRDINIKPSRYKITKKDGVDCGDCDDRVGEIVFVMGYGCY